MRSRVNGEASLKCIFTHECANPPGHADAPQRCANDGSVLEVSAS